MYKQNNRGNRFNRNRNNANNTGDRNKAATTNEQLPDEANIVIINFRQYAKQLDDKHDRYERIVKHSRDITIESKRIIFLLHTVDIKKNNKESVLKTANTRLEALFSAQFLEIARELYGLDAYQYARAFSAGLQEFIEAYTYYKYLSGEQISDWDELQKLLCFEKSSTHIDGDDTKESENQIDENADEGKVELLNPANANVQIIEKEIKALKVDNTNEKQTYTCLVQPIEFMLGIGDLSGEVMRHCINALNSGDLDECFQARRFMQLLYTGFMGLGPRNNKELSHKIYTLRQSVQKVENVCYNIKVRGGEATKLCSDNSYANHSSAKNIDAEDDDEGFANY